jgi:hypothetical protein
VRERKAATPPALFYPRIANDSGGSMMCNEAAEKLDASRRAVGSGPFVFKSCSLKEKMDLVALRC